MDGKEISTAEIEDFNVTTLASETPPRDDAYLLDLFIGKNSAPFLNVYKAMQSEKRFKWTGWSGINFVAGLFAFPWFFYRKLYLEGAALILIPVLLSFLFPEFMDKARLGLTGVLMILANRYYMEQSLKKVRAIDALEIPVEERDALLRSRGGVSLAGGIFGAVIFCALIGLFFLEASAAKTLPSCDAAPTKNLVKSLMLESLKEQNIPTDAIVFENFTAIGTEADERHTCSVLMRNNTSSATRNYSVEWENKNDGKFRVFFNLTP
ncbi:MAG: DUF2628 domain-containing protein [Rhodospirillales bacterium]|nr:DUF2628 domain-containing protein [Rhodospirillales bacterium]